MTEKQLTTENWAPGDKHQECAGISDKMLQQEHFSRFPPDPRQDPYRDPKSESLEMWVTVQWILDEWHIQGNGGTHTPGNPPAGPAVLISMPLPKDIREAALSRPVGVIDTKTSLRDQA